MRLVIVVLLALISFCNCQDENSEDIFETPLTQNNDDSQNGEFPEMPIDGPREEMNEGSDSFPTSTEMIEADGTNTTSVSSSSSISSSESSLEVKPIEKSSLFSPITPLDADSTMGGMFNFSKATFEIDSKEDDEETDSHEGTTVAMNTNIENETDSTVEKMTTSQPLDAITFSSIPIVVDEVADRRVLKEKEQLPPVQLPKQNKIESTTSRIETASDPSEIASDESDAPPFDQSAFEGIFEQDGSVIDKTLSTDSSPAFPILKMKEEDSLIITNAGKQSQSAKSESSTVGATTEKISEEVTTTATKAKEEESATEVMISSTSTETVTSQTSTSETEPATLSTEITTESSDETTTTTSSEEATTTAELAAHPSLANSSKVFLPAKAIRTPISFRITSLEYTNDFADIESGPSKKLAKSLVPHVSEFVSTIAGEDNLVNVDIKSFAKGSVIVSADLLTKRSLGDAQMAVNLLEAAVSRNNSILGEYTLDNFSVTVDGVTSQAYIDSISTQTSTGSLSSLMFIIISLSVVVIVAVALLVIFMVTRKKRQSTMKLSIDDTMRCTTPESTEAPHSVHLMSYGTAQRMSQKPPSPISKTQIDETNSAMY